MAKSGITFERITEGGDWAFAIDELLDKWNDGPPIIQGGLTVTGHSYWVILEYGSSPAESHPWPDDEDPMTDDETFILLPESIPPPNRHEDWYPIEARRATKLWFKGRNGKMRAALAVNHPGNHGRGFMRRVIHRIQKNIVKDLESIQPRTKVSREAGLPTRDDLVDGLNLYLLRLQDEIVAATPIGPPKRSGSGRGPDEAYLKSPEDKGHLAEAWGVDWAK